MGFLGASDDARVEVFRTIEEGRHREAELQSEGVVFTLIDVFRGATNGGLYMQTLVDGRIIPFSEACPDRAREIKETLRVEAPVRLYYLPKGHPDLPELFLQALAHYRERTIEV